ncbi:LOW QUALITY PROTEIN: hypothetical protein MXB_2250 [Myxobolus squamalis]|nr:LOW QUALITY PROTEIN: hypothetical protein MXB_2250 [Myxobolus squamalis]
MDEIESHNLNKKIKKLGKKDLLDLKRRHSQMIREQPCLVPVHEPPQLELDFFEKSEKKHAPTSSNKNYIMNILKEAGVDISTAVTINRKTYEETFNPNPLPVEMLKKHCPPKQTSINSIVVKGKLYSDRSQFIKDNTKKMYEARKDRIRSAFLPSRAPSGISDLQRDLWNRDQKKAQIVNSKGEYMQLYNSDEAKMNAKESCQASADPLHYIFSDTKATFDSKIEKQSSRDMFEDFDQWEKNNEHKKFVNEEKLMDSTQDIPLLCSGKPRQTPYPYPQTNHRTTNL